jgi:hypothetical protein
VLKQLARRAEAPEGLTMDDVVAWCWAITQAAGGVFGTSWRAIDDRERAAIQNIADTLRVKDVQRLMTKVPPKTT